jgi:pyruvate dehydrogenase E2 component (dihydrolipoamide acetyltransferase)
VPASPSTRRLARELGVEIARVPGSGPAGRISAEDVKAHVRRQNLEARQAPAASGPAPGAPLPDLSQWGPVERQSMSKVRRLTAERLSHSWATIPQVTQFDKADVTDLEGWRKQYGKKAEAAGGKLTPTAVVLKLVAAALRLYPQFNASVDMARQEVVYKDYCHVGVAVDTDRGLLVPVIRDVDRKNIVQLSVELGAIAEKARTRKLTPEDMQGGCFTISNLGGIGGTGFTPIINPPEVAILGVARHATEAVYVDGQLQPRLMLPLSLTYDHRLIDGADGARFLHWLVEALQNPFLVLLEG